MRQLLKALLVLVVTTSLLNACALRPPRPTSPFFTAVILEKESQSRLTEPKRGGFMIGYVYVPTTKPAQTQRYFRYVFEGPDKEKLWVEDWNEFSPGECVETWLYQDPPPRPHYIALDQGWLEKSSKCAQ